MIHLNNFNIIPGIKNFSVLLKSKGILLPVQHLKRMLNTRSVTGVSIHAPRQGNSTYIQTVRWSIYDTIRPEHPHSPICCYKQRAQGPPSWPRYMESCPDTALIYATATSTTPFISSAVTSTASNAPLRQDTAHRRISYRTLSPSLASAVYLVTVFNLI